MKLQRVLFIFLLAAPAMALLAEDGAGTLTAEEELGRQIYTQGASDRQITAVLGEGGTEVPASMMPCANCHGDDGRGRPEGGLSPSDITWVSLTRPWGGERSSGRRHPPYDERMLKRAFTMGLDPAGNRLHIAMPRYQLTLDEAAALVSYLRRLGQVPDPGVEDDSVRLGVLRSPDAGPAGVAMWEVLEAATAELSAAGGVYGRRLELHAFTLPKNPEERSDAVARFLETEQIFALVACDLTGADTSTFTDTNIVDLLLKSQVPLVGAFGIDPPDTTPPNALIFYLHAGPEQLARALVKFAATQLRSPSGRALVMHPPEALAEATALRRQGEEYAGPWANIAELAYTGEPPLTSEQAKVERDAGTNAVFFLGSAPHATMFLTTAAAIGWKPSVFLLGPRAGALLDTTPPLAERAFLAFPSRPADTTPKGFARYQKLALQYGLSREHARDHLRALAALDLLTAGLESAGRELSRRRLVDALETLDRHLTHLTPPLSFGPNRRVGALGAWVVPVAAGRRGLVHHDGTWIGLGPL